MLVKYPSITLFAGHFMLTGNKMWCPEGPRCEELSCICTREDEVHRYLGTVVHHITWFTLLYPLV